MSAGCADDERKTEAAPMLFGPQGTITREMLLDMRNVLQSNTALKYLSTAILELPALWITAVVHNCPSLGRLSCKTSLDELVRFFSGAQEPDLLMRSKSLPTNNIVMTTLTVVAHIIEFWKLTHFRLHDEGGVDRSQLAENISDVQGLCTGFLSAVCVSCACNEDEFQSLSVKAIRLAMCIGAWVDLDAYHHNISSAMAVRWKTDADFQQLNRTLQSYSKVSPTFCAHHSTT